MPQAQLHALDARLARAQERGTALKHWFERLLEIRGMFDLGLEIAALAKAFAQHEDAARRARSPQGDVQIENGSGAETPRKTRARQMQQFTDARNAHGAQGLQPIRIPGGAGYGQAREAAGEQRGIFDQCARACARAPQRRERRGRDRTAGRYRKVSPAGVDVGVQTLRAAEQAQAPLDFEQQRIRRFDADKRGKALCLPGEARQSRCRLVGLAERGKQYRIPQLPDGRGTRALWFWQAGDGGRRRHRRRLRHGEQICRA